LAKKRILNDILTLKPRLVGFSLIFQPMLQEFAALANYLRTNGVEAHFTIGGHFPSIEYAKTLEMIPELDSVVRYEGEQTLLELFINLENRENWSRVEGIAFRKGDEIVATASRPLVKDLDSLPFLIRGNVVQKYRRLVARSISASRGCYYNCSFCSVRQFYFGAPGLKRRSRSPANVADEMEQLFRSGTRIFKFVDDDLGMKTKVQKEWITDFSRELKNRNISDKILWRTSNRVDELDADCLKTLKEVGLTFLYLGIESGSDEGLQTCNKHYSVNDVYDSLRVLEDVDVLFDYGFMMLTPDSTFDLIAKDVDFLRKLSTGGRVTVHFTKMMPYAGTAIAERLKKEGRLEGTADLPTYRFVDPRLNLMEAFLGRCFHNALFGNHGIVNKLQLLAFDVEVLNRFFSERYDVPAYEKAVKQLTNRFNESALETIEIALKFMREHDYDDIIYYRDSLEFLAQQEQDIHASIAEAARRIVPERN